MINIKNMENFYFQRYDGRTYNRTKIIEKQAQELYNRGVQFVLYGYCGVGISNPVLFNPLPTECTKYMQEHSQFYHSYYIELAYPKNSKIAVKKVVDKSKI